MRRIRAAALLTSLVLVAAACGSDDEPAAAEAAATSVATEAEPAASDTTSQSAADDTADGDDTADDGGGADDGASASDGAADDSEAGNDAADDSAADDGAAGDDSGDGAAGSEDPGYDELGDGDEADATDALGEIETIVQDFVDANELNGAGLVLVERDSGIVYENYWGELSADRVSYIASSSKMISGGVMMKLDEDGLLDVGATVADTVEWGAGANPDITIAQLVSNTSGLVGLGPDLFYEPYLCQFAPNLELEACGETVFNTLDDDADIVPPDTEYRYGGAQWQVAGAVAETVSGKTWAELIQEIYVEPCGVDSLGFNNHWTQSLLGYPFDLPPSALVPSENPQIEGGAFITAPDYAQLVLMHLRGGECPNGQAFSPESIERLHQDRVGPSGAGDPNTGYGFGWWIERDTGFYTDPGLYGAAAFMDPAAGWGGYLVIEADGETGSALRELLRPTIEAAFVG